MDKLKKKIFTYKNSGVHIETGYEIVKEIKSIAKATHTKKVLGGLGSFGAMYELPKGFKNPVLVSGTDGVGTKLQIAFQMNQHKTIGIDCVAMCVNDIICHGATPLYFLDYISSSKLSKDQIVEIVEGIAKGCHLSGCSLIGGETAEMPGFYKKGEYDVAGFAVGVVEKSKIINGKDLSANDVLIGIESSGLHSNGFSLVRKLCFRHKLFTCNTWIKELGCTLGDELLKPTKLYPKIVKTLLENHKIKGIANITGGGWYENIPRIFLDDTLKAVVTKTQTSVSTIFNLLQEWGNIPDQEMYNTFNMGIGMVIAVDPEDCHEVIKTIQDCEEKAHIIGKIGRREVGEESIVLV